MGILEQYRQDYVVPAEALAAWSPKKEAEGQVARLIAEAQACVALQAIPRRLGADADARDLARDKLVARRVQHVMIRQACLWAGMQHPLTAVGVARITAKAFKPGARERQAGAQRNWDTWNEAHHQAVEHERSRVATYAIAAGERGFGNRAAHALTKEQEAVEYAFR